MELKLQDMRKLSVPPGELPKDASFTSMLISVVLGIVGIVYVTPFWLLMIIYKFFPGTLLCYQAFVKWYFRHTSTGERWLCSPCFCLGLLLMPLAAAAFFVIAVFHGLIVGAATGAVYLEHQSFVAAFHYLRYVLRLYDRNTNDWLMEELDFCPSPGDRLSCFDCCSCCRMPDDSDVEAAVRAAVKFRC